MTDWVQVRKDAIAAAQAALGTAWNACANGASAQIEALTTIGQYIEGHKGEMTQTEYQHAIDQQQTALTNILTGYQAIGIAAAQNAAAAVINVIIAALPGLVFAA